MHRDTMNGTSGEWVGMLGFSQGAKLAASLLYRQQESQCRSHTNFCFGILLAGSAPLALLDQDWDLSSVFKLLPKSIQPDLVLRIPTVHMHGLRDPGLHRHRQLYKSCRLDTARVLEGDGDHRVPIKLKDIMPLVQQIRDLAAVTDSRWTSYATPLDSKALVSCLEVDL